LRRVLRIVHHYEKPLFIYVLDLGLTGKIQMVYPVAGAEASLLPDRNLDVGKREGEELILYIPEGFPLAGSTPGDEETEGKETLKIFVTTHPAEFFPLLQAAYRGAKEGLPGPASSLSDLLSVTFGGGGYRDFRLRPLTDEPEDWTALQRSFRLRRQKTSRIAGGGRSF
jgi:hypothetical protein